MWMKLGIWPSKSIFVIWYAYDSRLSPWTYSLEYRVIEKNIRSKNDKQLFIWSSSTFAKAKQDIKSSAYKPKEDENVDKKQAGME